MILKILWKFGLCSGIQKIYADNEWNIAVLKCLHFGSLLRRVVGKKIRMICIDFMRASNKHWKKWCLSEKKVLKVCEYNENNEIHTKITVKYIWWWVRCLCEAIFFYFQSIERMCFNKNQLSCYEFGFSIDWHMNVLYWIHMCIISVDRYVIWKKDSRGENTQQHSSSSTYISNHIIICVFEIFFNITDILFTLKISTQTATVEWAVNLARIESEHTISKFQLNLHKLQTYTNKWSNNHLQLLIQR